MPGAMIYRPHAQVLYLDLSTGAQFIESGKHKKVLVVGGDKMSSIINYEDRTTCIIFGDGCGAVLTRTK